MTRTACSEKVQRRKAASRTIAETERRKRAAKTVSEREMLDSILDRAKRALAQATRELEAERG